MPPRQHRRAVGPPGAPVPVDEPRAERPEREPEPDDDDALRADRPPHHDRGT